jgi:hypothetical protein
MSLDVSIVDPQGNTLFEYNITHNLTTMAKHADLYMPLWRPEEIDIFTTDQMLRPLFLGYKKLKDDPIYFRQFNPVNGWGTYDGLLTFCREYLRACIVLPDSKISVWR